MSYVHLWEQGGWEERRAGRLLKESEILLGRWRNIGPGGNLRWMHLCTVFSNYIQVDFSCRIPCLPMVPFVISQPPSTFYYLDSGKAVNSHDCFPNLVGIETRPLLPTFTVTIFPTKPVRRVIFSAPLRPAIFNVLALADRFPNRKLCP